MVGLAGGAIVLGLAMALFMSIVPFTIVVIVAVSIGSVVAALQRQPALTIIGSAFALICFAELGYAAGVILRAVALHLQRTRRGEAERESRPVEKV